MSELDSLKRIGFTFNKRFGQNFITDRNLLDAICADAEISKDDYVVEVGAGAGTLTRSICERAGQVTTFEIDANLKPILSELQDEYDNLEIYFGDVLKFDIDEVTGGKPFKLVANLPYYITTPVIFHFLALLNLVSLTVMVQKEVAERFGAKENTASYGAVTAQLRAYGEASMTRIVPRQMFTPPPNVDSAIVNMTIQKKEGVDSFDTLKKTIASAFAMRRKTLANNLMASFSLSRADAEIVLEKASLPKTIRGEVLSIDDFINLSNVLGKR